MSKTLKIIAVPALALVNLCAADLTPPAKTSEQPAKPVEKTPDKKTGSEPKNDAPFFTPDNEVIDLDQPPKTRGPGIGGIRPNGPQPGDIRAMQKQALEQMRAMLGNDPGFADLDRMLGEQGAFPEAQADATLKDAIRRMNAMQADAIARMKAMQADLNTPADKGGKTAPIQKVDPKAGIKTTGNGVTTEDSGWKTVTQTSPDGSTVTITTRSISSTTK